VFHYGRCPLLSPLWTQSLSPAKRVTSSQTIVKLNCSLNVKPDISFATSGGIAIIFAMPQFARHTLDSLEFTRIREEVAKLCFCDGGKRHVAEMLPSTDPLTIETALLETQEMREIIEFEEAIPLELVEKVEALVGKIRVVGSILDPDQLKRVADFQKIIVALHQYRRNKETKYPHIINYLGQLKPLHDLILRIDQAIDPTGEIKDSASPRLRKIRNDKVHARAVILDRLNRIIGGKTHRADRLDDVVTMRDGRYVIPIPDSEYNARESVVHDRSKSGATLYVEPTEAIELNNKLKQLHMEEAQEIERILLELSDLARSYSAEIERNWELYGRLDFLHAKGAFAIRTDGVMPVLKREPVVSLQAAYHPLLLLSAKRKQDVVSLSLELGIDRNIIIVTGPNTGGKTVALKTVGLSVLMAQAGMLISADAKSELGVFDQVFADIGDEQSIELSLSTFSSHISRITSAIAVCDERSLVLFDEIGVGTDPKEGAALAEAVIEYVSRTNARCIVTTHYSALKAIAETNKKVENASMEFNRQTLQPTYRLRTGLPGSSYALEMAARLGMPKEVLMRAGELVGTQERSLSDLIARLESELMATESERRELTEKLAHATELERQHKEHAEKVQAREKQLLKEGSTEATKLVEETRQKLEALVLELQSDKPSKDTIKQSRKSLDDLRKELSVRAAALSPPPEKGDIPEVGDKVWIDRMQTDGEYMEKFADGKRARVRIGKVLYTMNIADLRKVSGEKRKSFPPEGVSYQPYKDDTPVEISLRGMTIEEAREALDKYFDEVSLSNVPTVRIVHGKGTGALKRMVREYLSKNTMVESFQLGEWNEGSWGVTIVKLKG
jgi:DNA mismatch repair protein MutS2